MKSALKLVLFPLFAIGVFGADEVLSVSVTEGDSFTLNSDVTEIQSNDEMDWRLNGNLIFRISSDSNNNITVFDNTNGVYGDRLKLNNQTGDLKFTHIKTTDSGEYKLKTRNTRLSSEKMFTVSVAPESGLSSDAIAGIVIGVIAAVAAAAAAGGVAYRERGQMSEEVQPLIK